MSSANSTRCYATFKRESHDCRLSESCPAGTAPGANPEWAKSHVPLKDRSRPGMSARGVRADGEPLGIDSDGPVRAGSVEEPLAGVEAENQRLVTMDLNLDVHAAVE